MISLDEVAKRFREDKDRKDHPTGRYLGIKSEDWRPSAVRYCEKLKSMGADMEWWVGKDTTTTAYIHLGPEPESGPSIAEVTKNFGFNYDIMLRAALYKIRRDMTIIMGQLGQKFDLSKMPGSPERLRKAFLEGLERLKELPPGELERLKGTVFGEIDRLKEFDPEDKPLWVVLVLKMHGYKDVDLDTWFVVDSLFDRVTKAETARFAKTVLGEDKFLGGLFEIFRKLSRR